MSAATVIHGIMALGLMLIAVFLLLEPKRRLPFAGASASVFFLLSLGQLLGMAKDGMAILDGVALIVMGMACGLILSEAIRRRLAEKPGLQEARS